jgi:DNA-binding response OmpR family regulator
VPVLDRKNVVGATDIHVVDSTAAVLPRAETGLRPQPEKVVSVLAISPFEDDHVFLGSIFSHSNWHLRGVRSWREALDYLSRSRAAVVLCEKDLPDSDWKQVLVELASLPDAPLMVVTSRWADDHLWAEVLNLGGYDVLMKPFDSTEVIRVVSLAWLNWKNQRERARRNSIVPGFVAAAGM